MWWKLRWRKLQLGSGNQSTALTRFTTCGQNHCGYRTVYKKVLVIMHGGSMLLYPFVNLVVKCNMSKNLSVTFSRNKFASLKASKLS